MYVLARLLANLLLCFLTVSIAIYVMPEEAEKLWNVFIQKVCIHMYRCGTVLDVGLPFIFSCLIISRRGLPAVYSQGKGELMWWR